MTLSQREQARLQVLNSLLAEHMTMEQASTLMGVSTRHTRRILAGGNLKECVNGSDGVTFLRTKRA